MAASDPCPYQILITAPKDLTSKFQQYMNLGIKFLAYKIWRDTFKP